MLTGFPPFFDEDQRKMHRDIIYKELEIKNLYGPALDLIQKLL